MKSLLTRIAVIAVCAVVVIVMLPRSCSYNGTDDSRVTQTFTPDDSAFAPVVTKQYRPPSTPFEKQKSPVKLPSDLRESDVKEAIRIIGASEGSHPERGSTATESKDTTVVILSHAGHIYANGGTRSLTVERIEYLPPLLDFGLFRQVGVTVSGLRQLLGGDFTPDLVSPAFAVSFIQIDGRFQLPTLLLDLDGVGIGGGYRISGFTAGAVYHHPFVGADQDSPALKIFVTYNF